MRLVFFKITSIFLLLLGGTGALRAQIDCENPECFVETLSLNTGVDHAIGTLYGVPPNQDDDALVRDPYWQTVQSPDPDINLGNPWVIPHVAVHWHNGPPLVARWLSPLRNTNYIIDNPYPDPPFIFERCFCTCESGPIELDFLVYGDDAIARVEFGGNVLFDSPMNNGPNFGGPDEAIQIRETVEVEAGQNCLRVHLRNTGGDRMGFKVEGTATGARLVDNPCCNPRGSIAGFKFDDQNANGVWDNGEPPLANWEINLSNNTSVLTDVVGFYSFNNLPPGNYTVSETQQAGWTQTLPANNQSYNVTLGAFQSLTLDFGNTMVEEPVVCCDDPTFANLFYEDFEGSVTNNATGYSFGTGQAPGQYTYLNSAQANTLSSGGWDVRGYDGGGNCDPNDRFMVVNGRTNGTGDEQIYRSAPINNLQDDESYSICVQFKHLPQCVFDVIPTVRVEVVGLNNTLLFASPSTQVNTGLGDCDYLTVSGTFTGVAPSGGQSPFIQISLDESGIGDGNDLVVDEILIQEIPIVPAALRTFSSTIGAPDPITGNFNVSVQAASPLPEDCTGRWEVYQIADANDPTTPIPGTLMTGNNATGWGASTNFPGYNSVPPAAGVFNENLNYVIRRIVDCDCYEEGATRLKIESTIEGLRVIFEGPEEAQLSMDMPGSELPIGELPQISDTTDDLLASDVSDINVIPNPFQERCTLIFTAPPQRAGTLQVMDLSGKLIQSIDYSPNLKSLELDLTNFPPATYIISGQLGDQVISKKIVKQ
ncbi:MAG: SdrD B-like domain-containing protein [Bacteroidota bacterium]